MMSFPLGFLAGLVLGFALVSVARRRGPERARRIYAVGLIVAAGLYVLFAAAGGASALWLALEGLGVVLYGSAAWLGLRGWAAILALGWAAHVPWDTMLHVDLAGAAYTPDWYPWLCVSLDLVLAGAVLALRGRHPGGEARGTRDEKALTRRGLGIE